ncbi:ATP-binding protein [Sphingomonas sp. LY160]|uniref:ATP-binding protein n=1 Tax=Sphingomonas sp. LY160 TaxID=3095342 RepID=UPI002ADEC2D3|nr:ATP-binding protein [Sphingomonas sp. LY160]MEA1070929.1 ATP-binding protein [Sphingomonas sp. LY160]
MKEAAILINDMGSRDRPAASRLAILSGIASFLLIALIGIVQFSDVRAGRNVVREIEESSGKYRLAGDYLTLLQDIETSQRGFVVTGKAEFLQPQIRAMRDIRGLEDRLSKSFANTSEQSAVAALIAEGRRKQSLSETIVALRMDGDEPGASEIIAGGEGKRVMDRARSLVQRVQVSELERERALLRAAAASRQDQQRRIILIELALIFGVASLLFAMLRSIRTLKHRTDQLADAAKRQAAIFEAANDAMIILDENGIITSANGAAERLFDRPSSELIGKSNLSLFADAPSEDVSKAYLAAIARQDGSAETIHTFVGANQDGSTFDAEVATTPVKLSDGSHYLAVARDATERRRIEKLKDEFVATVSHELRTPLTSIAGSLGLLVGGAAGKLPDQAVRLVGIAQSNCKRLIRLINDILDIEKMEAGKMPFHPQQIAVASLLEDAVRDSSGLASDHDVTLTIEPVAETDIVFVDPDRMAQVLANVLSNAIKHSPKGGTVFVSAMRDQYRQIISVADQGPGIPEEFRDRIFQKFAQADSSDTRSGSGTGLGLSIVREIVTRSGGEVRFESTAGKGTVFHIDLPAQTTISGDAVNLQKLERPTGDGMLHLLHVDDDPDTLRLVAQAFDGSFQVHSTPSVQEGDAALRRYSFDLVILDVAMSDGSGMDLVPLVRQSCPNCPVILYTAGDVDSTGAGMVEAVLTKSRNDLDYLLSTAKTLTRDQKFETEDA